MKRFILIDSHAIIHRAYHALPPLTSSAGEPVNAVYGFSTILLRMLRELKPDYIAAAFDLAGPTFRHTAYERYKAHRPETPSDLSSQFNKVKTVLDALRITMFEKEGFEADDIIGTIAEKMKKNKNIEVVIVTGDMDTLQLVRPGVAVYAMKKGVSDVMIYGEKEVQERYGITPRQMIDFKGLKGDPSDNIPGVKGIGEKTAVSLLQEFGSIEQIYKALKKKDKKITPAIAARLSSDEEGARFSRDLATIKTDVPLTFKLENLVWRDGSAHPELIALFQQFGFTSLVNRLAGILPREKSKKPAGEQQGMFGAGILEKKDAIITIRSLREWKQFIEKHTAETAALAVLVQPGDKKNPDPKHELFLITRKEKEVFLLASEILKEAPKDFFSKSGFIVYDAKRLIHVLHSFGQNPGTLEFDIKVAAYLVGEYSRDFSYLGIASRELGRLVSQDPREELMHIFDIAEAIRVKLESKSLDTVMSGMDMPLVRILADMEDRGILIDKDFLAALAKKNDEKIRELTQIIYRHAGEEFNINSSQQLSKILFEKLAIKTYGLRKTEKGGVISTSASELEKLKEIHPVIPYILQYREIMKLKTTYVDVLPGLADPNDARVHTTFNQTGTATGRLSSSDPNLQNIPIMTEEGREIRKAFIAGKNFLLASLDYSQIELRVAAALAKDKKMIEAFCAGLDIHALTASEVYNVPMEQVTGDLRRAAKTLNFGILYGMGPQALAEQTSMTQDEAKKFINEYFHDFFSIREYIEKTKEQCRTLGYVETLFGRRRYIPEIHSANWQMKREAERMAVNAPVQGTAADLVKLAMISVDAWIKKEQQEGNVRLLLQVHDELVFEIKESAVKTCVLRLKQIMEGVAELTVPLVVDAKVGQNWGEMRKI